MSKEREYNYIFTTIVVILLVSVGVYFLASPSLYTDNVGYAPEGVTYYGHFIKDSYTAGEIIKGKVNLSFSDVPAEVKLSSNFNGSISLLNFLEANDLNKARDFECGTPNCLDGYSAREATSGLDVSGENVVGFKVSGQFISIESVKFSVQSDVGASCTRQLTIDVLNDGEAHIINTHSSGGSCFTQTNGCFSPNVELSDAIIDGNAEYCEKVTLPPAPAYKLGAKIKNSTNGQAELKMQLYNSDLVLVDDCILPKHSQDIEKLDCMVNYTSPTQEEHFVCIVSDDDRNYKIKTETISPTCGTANLFSGRGLNADFEIFAQALEFDSFNTPENRLKVNDDTFELTYQQSLSSYVDDYILEQYGRDCLPNCIIPISFSGPNQRLNFFDIEISYDADGVNKIDDRLYRLENMPATITSEELELDLGEARFTIPVGTKARDFKFFINNELVFSKNISISKSFDFNVRPKFAAFGANVLFIAESNRSINRSVWNFGDGDSDSVIGGSVRHRYTDTDKDEFEMKVTLFADDGTSATKTFIIKVGDAKEIANKTIIDFRKRINDLDRDIGTYPEWIKIELEKQIDTPGLTASLNSIENDYNLATTDEDFQIIVLKLIDLNVPFKIDSNQRGTGLPLLIGFDNLDVSYIESISGDTGEEESLRNAIAGWMNSNFNGKVSFEKIGAFFDNGQEVILTKFSVDTNPISDVGEVSYFVIGHDVDIGGAFLRDYGQRGITGGGSYITLEIGEADKMFEFYIGGEFDTEDLGMYISPVISGLGDFDGNISPCNLNDICEESIGENKNNCEADCSAGRWPYFLILIIALLFSGLIVYIILQEWYKKHYEKSLFKNPNNLYNLVNFIYNARKAGLADGGIKKKLINAGWKHEKIGYAFRKLDGKRTGMYEIPLLKFMENKKVQKEIAKRQKTPVDQRFIGTRRRYRI